MRISDLDFKEDFYGVSLVGGTVFVSDVDEGHLSMNLLKEGHDRLYTII